MESDGTKLIRMRIKKNGYIASSIAKKGQGRLNGQGYIFSNISKGTAFLLQGVFETDPVAKTLQ